MYFNSFLIFWNTRNKLKLNKNFFPARSSFNCGVSRILFFTYIDKPFFCTFWTIFKTLIWLQTLVSHQKQKIKIKIFKNLRKVISNQKVFHFWKFLFYCAFYAWSNINRFWGHWVLVRLIVAKIRYRTIFMTVLTVSVPNKCFSPRYEWVVPRRLIMTVAIFLQAMDVLEQRMAGMNVL